MNGIRFNSICTKSARFLSGITPSHEDGLDGSLVVAALQRLEEKCGATLTMFYLEELSHKETAEVLGLHVGSIMSRMSRGKEIILRRRQEPSPTPVTYANAARNAHWPRVITAHAA